MPSPTETDVLVVGSGAAGLPVAIKLAETRHVTVLTKFDSTGSSTNRAQGGIAAVTEPDDSFGLHAADTIQCGAGLCDPAIVHFVVERGSRTVQNLMSMGMQFDTSNNKLHWRRKVAILTIVFCTSRMPQDT